WNTFISGFTTSNAVFLRIVELPDNGFAISGNTTFNGGGFILKTDASGTVVFMKSYGIQLYDCITDPTDDGFVLTTNSGNTISGIIKTNSSGDIVWSDARNFLPDPDHYYIARPLSNGNYLAVGTAYDNPSISNGSGLIACYNATGTILWSQRYAGPEWTTGFREFTELPDGSILLVGTSSQLTVPGLRTLITKVDSVGNVIWCKSSLSTSRINNYGYEFSDNLLYIAGNYEWSGVDIRPATIKIDSNGDVLWTRIHPEFDYINDVAYGTSNDFSINGSQMCFNNYRTFCSTDTALSQSCALYDTSYSFVNVTMTALATTPVAATPVTSATNLTRINFSAVNYVKTDVCVLSGIENNMEADELKVSIYPNPAQDNLTIEISRIDFIKGMNFILINSLGEVTKQFNLNAPNNQLNLKELNSGIYFYSIKNQNNVMNSGKIIIE
ncbi:MAG: T9SS type A sorting domain-containing protein, partial [Bacteroidetes bacterium]|nr:T9SS type A sorting domain-containing protein [Bacteroidota bacterium]